jgi:hypothetical protein
MENMYNGSKRLWTCKQQQKEKRQTYGTLETNTQHASIRLNKDTRLKHSRWLPYLSNTNI